MRLNYSFMQGPGLMFRILLIIACLSAAGQPAASQGTGGIVVNMASVDGIPLTPENVLAYSIQAGIASPREALVKGTIRYRQTNLSMGYEFRTTLRPGMNTIETGRVQPIWNYSYTGLKELFMDYHMLPQGTYEYCVTVRIISSSGEVQEGGEDMQCIYNKADDIFLINLMEPENGAKLYEHYPVFSWIVNYPFASQLTYRIRVAEIKEGQNAISAVTRNNPIYTESSLPQTTTTYPVYGRPLETWHQYGWTVDAYYKGILLGGAEPWKFTIIEDSELVALPRVSPFVDVRAEQNASTYYAVGDIKLKYVLSDLQEDVLSLVLTDADGKRVKIREEAINAVLGDNRYVIDFKSQVSLKHLAKYDLAITNTSGEVMHIAIKYVNPDFFK